MEDGRNTSPRKQENPSPPSTTSPTTSNNTPPVLPPSQDVNSRTGGVKRKLPEGGFQATKAQDQLEQFSSMIAKLKNENQSFHWQNNELKCENRRLLTLNDEYRLSQKNFIKNFEEMKRALIDQKMQINQLREENEHLRTLIHNPQSSSYPILPFPKNIKRSPESRDDPDNDEQDNTLPAIHNILERNHEKKVSSIRGLID